MRERDLAPDVEAEAEAPDALGRRQALERLENAAVIGARNPHPLVLDLDLQALPGDLRREDDRFPHPVLDRVRQQVGHHLLQPAAVPGPDGRRGDGQIEANPTSVA